MQNADNAACVLELLLFQPNRSTLFSFSTVDVWVLVLCPLTGKPIACRLPLYVPVSLSRLMLLTISLRRSFSIFMFDNSAVMSRIVWLEREPRRAVGWICRRAMRREATWGPTP